MDGEITIGTKLSTDKFDRQIVDLEKKMRKEEDKKIEKEVEISNLEKDISSYEQAKNKAKEYTEQLKELETIKSQIESKGNFQFVTPEGTVGFTNEYKDVQREIEKANNNLLQQNEIISSQGSKIDNTRTKLERLKKQHQEINDKVNQYQSKINQINLQKQQSQVQQVSNGFRKVGSSIQDAVRRAGNLVLGIFAIRSAYMTLRQASSYLASYDKQYAANIEYIKYALTQAIAPVLQYIVRLAATLLGYINAIVQGWFGINLFSRGSVKNFNKMKAGAGGVAKAAKEIKKQLAGFDEMNILSDQSSTGGGGGGGAGGAMPSFDLSALQGEPPEWLKWIIDHKDEILAVLAGIAAGLLALRFGLSPLVALGAALLVGGLVYAFESLLKYLKDPTWENFGKIIQGIGIAIIGLGIIIGVATGSWVVAIIGVMVLILGTIMRYWDQIKETFQKAIDYIRENWGAAGEYLADTLQFFLDAVDLVFTTVRKIFDGFITFFKGVFSGDWKMAWEGIKQVFIAIWDFIKGAFRIFGEFVYNTTVKPVLKFFGMLWDGMKTGAQKAWDWIKNIFSGIGAWFSGMINTIIGKFRDMGHKVGEVVAGAFKGVVNGILGAIERILNTPIRAINGLISIINAVPGVNLNKLNTFNLPRLKVGGIVNMPNKGTMLGGAITGEAGREGVVPLTDQQAMAELGREIGKNVLVNLTNITQMNGRIISRELKQVQSDRNFAFNS